VDAFLDYVSKALYTGHIGDGKIFVTPVTNAIRVRTGEEGMDALKEGELD
jgi:nitrogen regulatory protein PII